MDKLQEKIDEVLEAAGYGFKKVAINPFTGPGKTRPGLRPKNSNSSDTSIMDQGKGYKSEDLRDYKPVEGRGGKPQDITQVYSDHALKTISASKYDLKARFTAEIKKQAAKASGINDPIEATCAFTGAETLDLIKIAGVMDYLVRQAPVEHVIPLTQKLREMVGGRLGSLVGNLDDYLKARGMESVLAGETIGGKQLAQLKAESQALKDFMQTPGPSNLPGMGIAAALGALGGGATVHRMHEPYFNRMLSPRVIYQGGHGDVEHQPG